MQSLVILCGHLVGDYIFQNDWMASNKIKNHLACFVHCLCYTLACFIFCWWFLNPWTYLIIFLVHYPIDRWRLARVWMEKVSGQYNFANGPLSPWSIIIVDNVFHIVTLFLIGLIP